MRKHSRWGGATSAFAADDARTEIINADYYANISRSMELHEQVVDKYKLMKAVHDGKDFDVYSDDYAGAFIDEHGLLNIALVGESRSKLQTNSRQNGQVVYKSFAYSYNQLQEIMNAIEHVMIDFDVLAVWIEDKANQVFVEANDENTVSKIISYLQEKGLHNEDAIDFIVDPAARVENTAFDGDLLINLVDRIKVMSKHSLIFEFKCGFEYEMNI